MGISLRRPKVSPGLRDQLSDLRDGHWLEEGQHIGGAWSWPVGSRQASGAGNQTDGTNQPLQNSHGQQYRLRPDSTSTRPKMRQTPGTIMQLASHIKTLEGRRRECGLRLRSDIQVATHPSCLMYVQGREGQWQKWPLEARPANRVLLIFLQLSHWLSLFFVLSNKSRSRWRRRQ